MHARFFCSASSAAKTNRAMVDSSNVANKNGQKSFIDSGKGLEIMQHGALIDPKGKAPLSVACFMAGTGISVFTALTAEPVQLLRFTCQVHMNRNIAETHRAHLPDE